MKNIDAFDRSVAEIFATLYTEFPIPIKMEFSDAPIAIMDAEDSGSEMLDKFVIYENTIKWLIAAGYVNAESTNNQAAFGAVLSAKGLEILKLPSSLEKSGPTFGEKIVSSIKSGAIEAAKNTAQSAISKGLSLAITLAQNSA